MNVGGNDHNFFRLLSIDDLTAFDRCVYILSTDVYTGICITFRATPLSLENWWGYTVTKKEKESNNKKREKERKGRLYKTVLC